MMLLIEKPDERPLSLWQVALSVLAAFFGVQSEHNRQRDFRRGRPIQFIVIGVLATMVFVLVMILAVKLVLRFAVS